MQQGLCGADFLVLCGADFLVFRASSLRLWDVSDAKKHLQVIKAKDKQGRVQLVCAHVVHCFACVMGHMYGLGLNSGCMNYKLHLLHCTHRIYGTSSDSCS